MCPKEGWRNVFRASIYRETVAQQQPVAETVPLSLTGCRSQMQTGMAVDAAAAISPTSTCAATGGGPSMVSLSSYTRMPA